MKVAVLDDYQDAFRTLACFGRLAGHDVDVVHAHVDGDELVGRLRGADAVLMTMQRTALPRDVLTRLPDLKLISQTGRNLAHIDLDVCRERGIVVSAGGSGGPNATAELTWALILAASRHIPREVEALKQGRWQTTVGTGLSGTTLGVYAYGRIGALVARVGQAFGMRVLCWGREGSSERARADGVEVADNRERFFETVDVLTLHLQLNEQTRGIVTADDLARMKPTSLLVNTSRAPLIEPGTLAAALKAGRPGRAAVDVYETEPVPDGDHPLLALGNVVCTPHLGYVERGTYEILFSAAVDQILAFDQGRPINVIA